MSQDSNKKSIVRLLDKNVDALSDVLSSASAHSLEKKMNPLNSENLIILGESSFMSFSSLRENVIRIPEVSDIINQAQKYWDELRGVKSLVISNTFYSTDDFFFTHPEYKSFLSDLVQYALFLRLKNQNKEIKYLLANINLSRAHLLVLGLQSLKEFVYKHPAVRGFNVEPKQIRSLRAVHFEPKYSLFRPSTCGIKTIKTSAQASEIFDEINKIKLQRNVNVINLGLGQNIKFIRSINSEDAKLIKDSIFQDKKLSLIFESTYSSDVQTGLLIKN